jgi:general secretion pathway protein D
MVMQVIPMRFVSSLDMSKILTPYLSDAGNMLVHEKGNILIVTDNRENMRKLLELVDIFDADVFQKRRVQLYEIKNHRAKSMVTDLESIFAAYSLSAKDSAIRFIPIEKINAILAVSPNPGSFGEVRNWIERLDQNMENMAIRTYVYKVENSKADHIAKLLSQIFTQKIDLIQPPSTTPASSMPGQAEPPQSGAQASIAGFVQGDIRVVADEIYNMLIIQASPQDYKTIQETIRELDIVPRQVLIDAKIYEIQLSGAFSMGVQWFLQNRTTTARMQGKDAAFTAGGAEYSGVTYPKGLSLSGIAWMGGATELIAFLNAQETHGRTRVLSAPSILASDNVMARIQVGSEVPMLSSQGVVPGGTGGGGSIFSGTVSNRSTGVILAVTPRINSSGWVTLKIQQEVSSPGEPIQGGLQTPQINVKSVDTQATVKDGETIVIGGIISENNERSINRVPVLGNIPILGYLFGNTTMSKKRNELIVMITPHVVQSLDDASAVSAEFKKKIQGLKRELRLLDILKPDSK